MTSAYAIDPGTYLPKAAEALAAPIMVAILALLFRLFLRPDLVREAKEQAEKGIMGRMSTGLMRWPLQRSDDAFEFCLHRLGDNRELGVIDCGH